MTVIDRPVPTTATTTDDDTTFDIDLDITRIEPIDAGDVLEINVDGETISALVLLATDTAVILDACDDTTPFVVKRTDLLGARKFDPSL